MAGADPEALKQRSRNRHPLGRSSGLGTTPGIASRRRLLVLLGKEFSKPMVYGCSGLLKIASGLARSTILAGIHDGDLVGLLRHDAEVVGNEQQGHAELVLKLAPSDPGSGPEWSGPGPSSVRRR